MRQDKLRALYNKRRTEILDEIAEMRAQTKTGHIRHALDRLTSELIWRWSAPRTGGCNDTEARRARYEREQAQTLGGRNRGSRWSGQDERTVVDTALSDVEVAKLLGRTTKAVRRKRQKLLGRDAHTERD